MRAPLTRNQQRFESEYVDLVAHARAILAGRAKLTDETRAAMIRGVGIKPSPGAPDAIVARAWLAARGLAA